jgi:uncharacterized protein (DUF2147 family)
MRIAILFGCVIAFASNPALAEEPTGDWLVAEGTAQIHIENCGNALWGFVAWEKEPGGRDTENPDPSKRDRPTLGLPILLNMQASTRKPGWWDGEVYNAQNGKTYASHIALEGPGSLRIEGCVLQILCGGQTWTRVKPPDAPAAATPAKSAPAAKTGAAGTTGISAKGASSKPVADAKPDYCSSVADLARASH